MAAVSEKLYKSSPRFIQNLMVTGFNLKAFSLRRGGDYRRWKDFYAGTQSWTLEQIREKQSELLRELIKHTVKSSEFYRELYRDVEIDLVKTTADLVRLPSIDKETIRLNLDKIITIPKSKGHKAATGGSTGASLKVYYTSEDIQKRQAALDVFRERYGYKLGLRTAWLSGKSLLSDRDILRGIFWKTDLWHRIRYYSTFHITKEFVPHYIKDLNDFQPEIISGFPSSIYEIARFSESLGLAIQARPKVIFTTSETLLPHARQSIERAFRTPVKDQYASNEGSPFIVECPRGRMHAQLLTGVFEIVDEDMRPATEGEVLVTSFSTYGTPLIRYRVGDRMKISSDGCDCGDPNPVIASIEGRKLDFVFTRERGKINLANLTNSVKPVRGIVQFQVEQNSLDKLLFRIVKDASYGPEDERAFLSELRSRLGDKIKIEFSYPPTIPRSPSGKFQSIINTLPNQPD